MCTGICIKSNEGDYFFGRTMDLAAGMFGEDDYQELPTSIVNYPKDVTVNGTLENWQTKYAVVGMGITDTNVVYDGVNEKGLAGDAQVLVECTHASNEDIKDRNQTPVIGEEFVSYILTQFDSVQAIRDAYQQLALSSTPIDINGNKLQFPLHYAFVDESGDGIVLEPVEDGSFKAYDFMGTMTNSPEYNWQLTNLNNYIGLNTNDATKPHELNNQYDLKPIEGGTGYGLFGLPGDYTSPSRFVRASLLSNYMDKFESNEGINSLYAAFRGEIIPRGLEHAKRTDPITDYTRYWAGYDLTNRKLYVQTGNGLAFSSKGIDPELKEITFTPVDTSNYVHQL